MHRKAYWHFKKQILFPHGRKEIKLQSTPFSPDSDGPNGFLEIIHLRAEAFLTVVIDRNERFCLQYSINVSVNK